MKVKSKINTLHIKNGLRSLILLLGIFSFSGYTGHIHTPQKTPAQTEQIGVFHTTSIRYVESYKHVVHRLYKSCFQVFNLKYTSRIKSIIECIWFKTNIQKAYTIIRLSEVNIAHYKPFVYTEYPLL